MSLITNVNQKRWPPSQADIKSLIEVATIDAYGDAEQCIGLYTMLEEHLDMPFDVEILGARTTVTRVDMTADEQIVAICKRGRFKQAIPILDLPIPSPPPAGAEWIEAYRRWARGG
jgi:hypothetical protein